MEHTYTLQTGIKKGIKYINDLIKEDGEFYTLEEFIETTGIQTNHLQYYGTLRAIKLYLKHVNVKINSKNQNPIIPNHIHPLLKQKKMVHKLCIKSLIKIKIYQLEN